MAEGFSLSTLTSKEITKPKDHDSSNSDKLQVSANTNCVKNFFETITNFGFNRRKRTNGATQLRPPKKALVSHSISHPLCNIVVDSRADIISDDQVVQSAQLNENDCFPEQIFVQDTDSKNTRLYYKLHSCVRIFQLLKKMTIMLPSHRYY
jgi:hypothetical protein